MSDRTQIGPSVDAGLWQEFREDVKARKGAVRGNLGTELDKALREYLSDSPRPTERRIDARLTRIEDALGVAEFDGGVDTSEPVEHTHAPTEKPAANAATDKKTRWLARRLTAEVRGGPDKEPPIEVSRDTIREVVKDEYGFRRDTAKRYVVELIDHLGYVSDPRADTLVCTPDRRDELLADRRDGAADDANNKMDSIVNAERDP
jgi:hypothetical protein